MSKLVLVAVEAVDDADQPQSWFRLMLIAR